MSLLALRTQLRRWRHDEALLALLSALIAVVALHHGAPVIGDAHHHAEIAAVAEMCLGVLTAVGAAVAAAALALIALRRWPPAILLDPPGVLPTARPAQPQARAGPALLMLLCVNRR